MQAFWLREKWGWVLLTVLLILSMGIAGCQMQLPGLIAVGDSMMTTSAVSAEQAKLEANKAFIEEYFAALNQDKTAATVDKYVADEVLKHHIEMFEASFPGYQLKAEKMIAEGDEVFVLATCTGVHSGDMAGIAPTGKAIELPIALTYKIVDGKIIDHLMLFDQVTLLQQLGVMPTQ
jgi:predicted ester cyclase